VAWLRRISRWTLTAIVLLASGPVSADREGHCVNPKGFRLTAEVLAASLAEHERWIADSKQGKRAILCRLEGRGLDFKGRDLRGIDLRFARLPGADFSGARLDGASLGWVHLEGANLGAASLNRTSFYKGVLRGADLTRASGRRANLRKADLSRANLVAVSLPGADIGKSNLRGARLDGADLSGAKLRKSDLSRASFRGTNLSGTNLRKALFVETALDGANLSGADFRKAQLQRVSLEGVDLSPIIGVSTMDRERLREGGDLISSDARARALASTARPATVPGRYPGGTRSDQESMSGTASGRGEPGGGGVTGRSRRPRKTSAGSYRVQLGAFRRADLARRAQERFSREYADLLGTERLVLETVRVGKSRAHPDRPDASWHRVRSGLPSSLEAARALCRAIRDTHPSSVCIVVK